MILSEGQSVQIVLGGAVATNQVAAFASYATLPADASSLLVASLVSVSAGATPVAVVPAPPSNLKRQVKYLSVYNADTAPVDLTVQIDVSGTPSILAKFLALPVGARVEYVNGFRAFDSAGTPL